MYECRDCGDIVEEVVNTYEGEVICESCYEENYSICHECGEVHHSDDVRWFNDHLYCEGCFDELVGYCQDCECEVHRDDLTDVGNNVYYWVCPDCVSSHICERCENTFGTLYDGLCEDCYNECDCSNEVDDIIEGYSYKPEPIFFGGGDRFFGVELETEPLDEGCGDSYMVREVQSLVSEWAYLKHDGSLNSGGFELVSHPMTLDHHFSKFSPELFDTIKSSNYVSHTNGNCGLHIHISRTAFNSDLSIVKLLEFIYGNYNEVVKKLGRRKDITSYCRNNEVSSSLKSIDSILRDNRGDRYHAINTQNSSTIELRFFRGTLVRDTFISALQFADVLVNLANKIDNISQKIEWSDVFIETLKLGYNELNNEFVKRLDIDTLINKKYEGYEIEEEEEEPVPVREGSSSAYGIIWSNNDVEQYSLEVLNEFNDNYINRFNLDNGDGPILPIGTFVQVVPLTMMRLMEHYGVTYPERMREFAGMIYRVRDVIGRYYRLDTPNGMDYYTWNRSAFRVLSVQEVFDMGLV